MIQIQRLIWFLKFYFKSKTLHNIHSPYLFEFLKKVSQLDKNYYDFIPIERLRTSYNYNKKELNINDLGAGTSKKTRSRTVADISLNSSSYKMKARLLYNLSAWFKPSQILEFGTNLGLGSAYLQKGHKNASVTTLEGDKNIHKLSQESFKHLRLTQIKGLLTSFEDYIIENSLEPYDFIYIDGNHTYDFTVQLFDKLIPLLTENKVLVFDDIYWSKGMVDAWSYIKESLINHKIKGYSIDLFIVGIVIVKKEAESIQHIKFIPRKYKPFSTGLFG